MPVLFFFGPDTYCERAQPDALSLDSLGGASR